MTFVLDDWNKTKWIPLEQPIRLVLQIYINDFMPEMWKKNKA